jgi:Phage terminase, small subunit
MRLIRGSNAGLPAFNMAVMLLQGPVDGFGRGSARVNARQRRFVDEYLVDLNAAQAAIRAGYSAKVARSLGQRLLTNVDIQTAIKRAEDARALRLQVRSDEVLRELVAIVRTNPSHFVLDELGDLALANEADTESWRAVASVKRKTRTIPRKDDEPIIEREVEFRLWDKNSAIDKAMRHLGILETVVRTPDLLPTRFVPALGMAGAGGKRLVAVNGNGNGNGDHG